MKRFTYRGEHTSRISFPLGGIGAGCIGLAGNGRLIDWEIFNRPNKNSVNGFTHFAVKAEHRGEVVDARVLQGDLPPPYEGSGCGMRGFGFGPARETLAGLPHFEAVTFTGEFPMASLSFRGRRFPGRVELRAFNPFIPLDDVNSGIPAAFFEVEIHNTTRRTLNYTALCTLANPLPAPNINRFRRSGSGGMLCLSSRATENASTALAFGDLCLAGDARNMSFQEYWFQGRWFDSLEVYWRDLTTPGPFRNRRYPVSKAAEGSHGVLAARCRLAPGKNRVMRFVIAWNFPNRENDWSPDDVKRARRKGIATTWKNYYATIWKNSRDTAAYALRHWDRLRRKTLLFKDAMFASDLPPAALDAVSANLSILKSPTVMRLEDGTFYGWEGVCECKGCCQGSCTHVWNYAQALPFLFPKLERSMREADYRYNQQRNGGMPFRLRLPLGLSTPGGRSCADGLFGGVMKAYRDWKICGDDEWLRSVWPAVKKSIAFAWDSTNEDRWDPKRTGVLWGRQHHTLDMELFGPNAWLTGFYLGALKAAAEMADHLGELEEASDYRRLFERGKTWVDEHLFNGDYYVQQVDLRDRSLVKKFGAERAYWDAEHGEIKYQVGEGCGVDQVLAQWHANLYGLGELFHPKQTRRALRAVFRHNFKRPMRDMANPCRIYCLNDEAGLVICEWPEDVTRPAIPLTYAQETMNGFEYAAAGQMIQNGMVEQGMTVVEAVRERYDGKKRNPWNEFECGSNYARSLASYALLNAFSGFEFDLTRDLIGFNPIRREGRFRCFWCLDPAWGEVVITDRRVDLRVLSGRLRLKCLRLPFLANGAVRSVLLGGSRTDFVQADGEIRFRRAAWISKTRTLSVRL